MRNQDLADQKSESSVWIDVRSLPIQSFEYSIDKYMTRIMPDSARLESSGDVFFPS